MAGMVTSDSDDDTASRNDYVAGIETTKAHLLPLAGCVKIIHFRHIPFKLNKPAVLNWEQKRCYHVPEN